MAAAYKPVSISVEDEGDDDIELTAHRIGDGDDDAEDELGLGSKQAHHDEEDYDDEWIKRKPTLHSATSASTIHHHITLILLVPVLLCGIAFCYSFTGRLWPAFGIAFHLHLRLGASHRFHFPKCQYNIISSSNSNSSDATEQKQSYQGSTTKLYSFANYLDVLLCVFIYPLVIYMLTKVLFRDVDGTINFDWKHHVWLLRTIGGLGFLVGILRICELLEAWQGTLSYVYCRMLVDVDMCTSTTATQQHKQQQLMQSKKAIHFATYAAMILHISSILSIIIHLGPIWPDIRLHSQECNPLDSSLCALPFPSFHHLVKDESTDTGYRVNLRGLPPLKGWFGFGSSQLHPTFLNELDGFSTMAPVLFYLEGLKEAHEAASSTSSNKKGGEMKVGLQGPANIQYSTTNRSITLLINVNEQQLVAHSAEIDYLDPKRPLVMVIPAKPLRHNTHYAVAVVNARYANGLRLPMSEGLKALLTEGGNKKDYDITEQYNRYKGILLPALSNAAPWINTTQVAVNDDRSNLEHQSPASDFQLLFDFVTMSESVQIGTVRSVRDLALQHVDNSADGDHQTSSSTWNWQEHVELVSEIKHNCNKEDIARTYHINLDVPFFLNQHSRYSTLDKEILMALKEGYIMKSPDVVPVEKAKAIIRVPCSVEKAAFGMNVDEGGKAVKTIMEFGHGLFGRRDEVMDGFLSRMANDNGYILMAMDWRGMSRFDLPVVIKTLIGNPNLFQSIRDNLIQGYANKLVLQHFARYAMLDWLKIDGASIPTLNDERPASVFYGISQGGILGGGYMALSGKTSLIDRGILGSPGTPFASVLTRSLDFIGYDTVMLFNQYSNRHVRFLISLLQMGWDSVEVSGLLAPPVKEILPPILIQTGLGDPIVGAGACESMARAMNASVLSNNPRSIFGVPVISEEEEEEADKSSITTPKVVLTEIMYEEEYTNLPEDNAFPYPGANTNHVHWCVRWDDALISQVEEFANTGRVIDPCAADQCRRTSTNHCISTIINS